MWTQILSLFNNGFKINLEEIIISPACDIMAVKYIGKKM